MASKWKYASLPASERLGMIKSGNKDVYKDEIARSVDVIKSRSALGLDISEQKDWIDSVSYNYNLYNASRMGIDEKNVNKTGYAEKILGDSGKSGRMTEGRSYVSTESGGVKYTAKRLLNEYYDKVAEAEKGIDTVREWLLNNGIEESSADGKKYIAEFEKELEALKEKYSKEYASKLKAALS